MATASAPTRAARCATPTWCGCCRPTWRRWSGTFGPGGWTLAQYVCGWMAHGLCLAAAAHGLYARPSRAFDEVLLHPVVGMASGEIVLAQRGERGGPLCRTDAGSAHLNPKEAS